MQGVAEIVVIVAVERIGAVVDCELCAETYVAYYVQRSDDRSSNSKVSTPSNFAAAELRPTLA